MLKYSKVILEIVSFNRDLFRKELAKSLNYLKKEEIQLLKAWCVFHFGSTHTDAIREVFNTVAV